MNLSRKLAILIFLGVFISVTWATLLVLPLIDPYIKMQTQGFFEIVFADKLCTEDNAPYNEEMDIMEWKRRFLEYTEIEKGRSLLTVANYDRYLSRFLSFAKVKMPEEITCDMVREYRLWLNRLPAQAGHG